MPEPSAAANLTVGRAAAALGVTVRTLHHWDEVGLARPSSRSQAGYRLYTADDLARLRRILIYRELGLDLDAIRAVLDDPETDVVTALRAQQDQLTEWIQRLQSLSAELDRMIRAQEHGLLLSAEEQSAVLGPEWDPQWPAEARERYGDSPQWQQYAERAASRSPDDWRAVAETTATFEQTLASAMAAGVAPGSPDANALAQDHRDLFSAYFPITVEMQVVLGRMFATDPAYAAHYDSIRPGLAAWLHSIIAAAARDKGVDPETAVWR